MIQTYETECVARMLEVKEEVVKQIVRQHGICPESLTNVVNFISEHNLHTRNYPDDPIIEELFLGDTRLGTFQSSFTTEPYPQFTYEFIPENEQLGEDK